MINAFTIKGFSLVYFKILITNIISHAKQMTGINENKCLTLSGIVNEMVCMACISNNTKALITDVAMVR
ncbi:hypothetical protein GCM10011500_00550 [Mucilaginibacter rubeus]|nr:hypothetical protein GCM10011500_00550 [Mucilaginibacter rubeus]